jgi:hypothetical protein
VVLRAAVFVDDERIILRVLIFFLILFGENAENVLHPSNLRYSSIRYLRFLPRFRDGETGFMRMFVVFALQMVQPDARRIASTPYWNDY